MASALLDEACRSFAAAGLTIAEAYPRKGAFDEASNFHGPLPLYLEMGFAVFREHDDWSIVSKRLPRRASGRRPSEGGSPLWHRPG